MGSVVSQVVPESLQNMMNADTYEAVGISIDETQPFGGYTDDELAQRLQHEFRTVDKKNKGRVAEEEFKLALLRVRQLRMTDRFADRMFLSSHVKANPHEYVCTRNRDDVVIFDGIMVLWKAYLDKGLSRCGCCSGGASWRLPRNCARQA